MLTNISKDVYNYATYNITAVNKLIQYVYNYATYNSIAVNKLIQRCI